MMGKPDWDFWGGMKVKPWQGCALSLDLDPDGIRIDPNSWMAGPGAMFFEPSCFPSKDVKSAFDKRLRLVTANLSSFELSSLNMGNAGLCEMTTRAFAKGAISLGLNIPQELADLVKSDNSSPSSHAVKQSPPGPDKPLATIERNTLLTIIAALCDYSAIKPQERGAASQIAKLTEEMGAAVSDDTVRRVLEKIPGALESRVK